MAIGAITPFRPTGTVSINAGTTSSAAMLVGGRDAIIVTNACSPLAYSRSGADRSLSASTIDMPEITNQKVMLSISSLVSHVAVVLIAGRGAVLFSRGDGAFV